jgi:hypothetical protein
MAGAGSPKPATTRSPIIRHHQSYPHEPKRRINATKGSCMNTATIPASGACERPAAIAVALRRLLDLPDLKERFALGLLNVRGDETDPEYWRQRSRDFLWAAPRRGDYQAGATREQLLDQWERCRQLATLCQAHADLLEELGDHT